MDKPDVDFIEGLSPGHLDRPEVGLAQPAVHRRHHHRGLRLPPAALRPHRRAPLPRVRRADHAADPAADRRPDPRAARGHPLPGAGPGGAGPQGHLRDAARRPRRPGLRPRPHRRRGARAHRQGRPGPLRAAHHRGGRRPARGAGRPRATAHRLARDGAAAGRRRGRGAARAARRRGARRGRRRRGRRHAHLLASTWPAPTATARFEELAPRNFSFNSPYGACETCDGLGTRFEVDPELIVPEPRPVARRRRHHPVGQRQQPVLQAPGRGGGRGAGRRRRRALVEAHQEAAAGVPARHRRGQGAGPLQEPLRPGALVHRQLRGRRALPPAPAQRVGERQPARADRGLHAGGALPRVRRRPPRPAAARRSRSTATPSPRSATCRSARRPRPSTA